MSEETKTLKIREISYDGIMSFNDVQLIVGLSRVTIWREERAGRFPARVQLTGNRVGWYGNEVKNWMETRPRVNPAQLKETGQYE